MRHRIIEIHQEIFNHNEHEVSKRWTFEEAVSGICVRKQQLLWEQHWELGVLSNSLNLNLSRHSQLEQFPFSAVFLVRRHLAAGDVKISEQCVERGKVL